MTLVLKVKCIWPNVGVDREEILQQRSMSLDSKIEHEALEALQYQYCCRKVYYGRELMNTR